MHYDNLKIDFQKINTRNDNICLLLDKLNDKTLGFLDFINELSRIKIDLSKCAENQLKEQYEAQHLKTIISKLIEVYLFLRLVYKNPNAELSLRKLSVPEDILGHLKGYFENNYDNGLLQKKISVCKNSKLNKWIIENYLSSASKMFRGIFGYSVAMRWVFNQSGSKKEWDDRYEIGRHGNYHWDSALNSYTMIIYLTDVKKSDGAFRVLKDSIHYKQNMYLSVYDRIISDLVGLKNHICSDRVGAHILKVNNGQERYFDGPAGTAIIFYGREIAHDGGLPDAGGSRVAVFIDQRNFLMRPLIWVSKFLAYIV